MNFSRLLLFFILLSLAFISKAQTIIYNYPQFYLDDKEVTKNDIISILEQKEESNSLLIERQNHLNKSNNGFYIAGAGFLLSVVIFRTGFDSDFAIVPWILTFSSVSTLAGVMFGVSHHSIGSQKLKKAINAYNEDLSSVKEIPKINFGLTSSGIGIIYTF